VTDVVVQRVGQADSSASKQGQPPARLPDAMVLLQGVAKTYRTAAGEAIEALQRIDLTIAAEEFVSVIGASGCGKTTLLRIIAGLEPEYGGELWLDGRKGRGPSRNIGIVFQDPNLLPWRTVLNNVLLPAIVLKLDLRRATERARGLLELAGLKGFENKYPFELSGGMRQRVAIARARLTPGSVDPLDGRAVRRARRAHAGDDEHRAVENLDLGPQDRVPDHPLDLRSGVHERPRHRLVPAARPHRRRRAHRPSTPAL